jgi:uncharacterized protein YggE
MRAPATILVIAVFGLPVPALAQTQEMPRPQVTVPGEATLAVAPDTARLQAGVISEGRTAREASEANKKTMAAVMAAITSAGIAEKDIQTSRYSIQPIYDQGRPVPGAFKGFQASNNVTVKIRDLDKIGDIIDQTVAAGANSMGGVEFLVAEPSKMLDAARAEAVADARRKAEILAEAAGVKLGSALTITEQSSGFQYPQLYMRAAGVQAGETPVAAGEMTLRAAVTVSFELLK